MIKVEYNLETGKIIGFYSDNFEYDNIPEPNISIEDDFYNENITELISGKFIVNDGMIVEKYSTDIDKLNNLKKLKISYINNNYINLSEKIDNEFNCYNKRLEFDILSDNDETSYQIAKTLYVSATQYKRETKALIENSVDYDEVYAIKIPDEWLTYIKN